MEPLFEFRFAEVEAFDLSKGFDEEEKYLALVHPFQNLNLTTFGLFILLAIMEYLLLMVLITEYVMEEEDDTGDEDDKG